MIAVIDYGLGNLRSVSKALEFLGAEVKVTSDAKTILEAGGAVLPGVGAFYKGMENIEELNLSGPIKDFIKSGKPLLGICLGLQLLFTESEEHGMHRGLDIIKGKVTKFMGNIKVPHMGWNAVSYQLSSVNCQLFENIPENSYFYFVHSYFVAPTNKTITAGTTEYGHEFCSAVAKENIYGVQFHPEKSAETGLKLLANFLKLC